MARATKNFRPSGYLSIKKCKIELEFEKNMLRIRVPT